MERALERTRNLIDSLEEQNPDLAEKLSERCQLLVTDHSNNNEVRGLAWSLEEYLLNIVN